MPNLFLLNFLPKKNVTLALNKIIFYCNLFSLLLAYIQSNPGTANTAYNELPDVTNEMFGAVPCNASKPRKQIKVRSEALWGFFFLFDIPNIFFLIL